MNRINQFSIVFRYIWTVQTKIRIWKLLFHTPSPPDTFLQWSNPLISFVSLHLRFQIPIQRPLTLAKKYFTFNQLDFSIYTNIFCIFYMIEYSYTYTLYCKFLRRIYENITSCEKIWWTAREIALFSNPIYVSFCAFAFIFRQLHNILRGCLSR